MDNARIGSAVEQHHDDGDDIDLSGPGGHGVDGLGKIIVHHLVAAQGAFAGDRDGVVRQRVELGGVQRGMNDIALPVVLERRAVGVAPVGGSFGLFGELGGFFWNIDTRTSINNVEESFSGNGVGLLAGIGASYQFSKSVSARVEYELMKDVGDSEDTTGKGDISLVSAGIAIHFH